MQRHPTAIRHATQALLALVALLGSDAALACSCANQPRSGFIHAELERLPSNARGALFLLPRGYQGTLGAEAFVITSDRDQAALPAQVTWPRFNDNDTAPPTLARVGPSAGFQPGVRYTIRYAGAPGMAVTRAATQFTIDATPLVPGPIALSMEGAPTRQMLPMSAGSSCSDIKAAVVGNFHYELPGSYAPYRSIVMYQSQARTPGAAYAPIEYAASLCEHRKLGVTAHGDGRDLVHASCKAPPALLQVRGRAGLLEVEDALQVTEPVTLDLAGAAGAACDPAGMLREALASDDGQRIRSAVCGFPRHQWGLPLATTPERLPAPSALFALAQRQQAPPRACIAQSVARILAETGESAEALGRFLAEDFSSGDDQRITEAYWAASQAAGELGRRGPPMHVRKQQVAAFWRPILPVIAGVVAAGTARSAEQLAQALAREGKNSQPYVPQLIAGARKPAPSARPALIALARLIPQDRRLRVLLRRAASEPALLETAAVEFAKVAMPAERPEVVRLLARAIDADSREAIYSIKGYGKEASAAIPALLRRLQRDVPRGQTALAFESLLKVWQGEPEVTAALSAVLLQDGKPDLYYHLDSVAATGATGRPLAPTLRVLLTKPLPERDRQAAEKALKAITL